MMVISICVKTDFYIFTYKFSGVSLDCFGYALNHYWISGSNLAATVTVGGHTFFIISLRTLSGVC